MLLLLFACGEPITESRDFKDLKLKGPVQSVEEFSYEAILNSDQIELGKLSSPSWQDNNAKFFDRNGNLSESMVYKGNGDLKNKLTYEHDENGFKTVEYTYMANGNLLYKKEFQYNEIQKIKEIKMQNADGKEIAIWKSFYDKEGKKTEEDQYFPDRSNKPVIRSIFKYDEHGNKIQEHMYNPEDRLIVRWLSKYDANHVLVEENYYYSDGSLNSRENYEYEYDKYGNWTKQIVYENDQPKHVIVRKFTYY